MTPFKTSRDLVGAVTPYSDNQCSVFGEGRDIINLFIHCYNQRVISPKTKHNRKLYYLTQT